MIVNLKADTVPGEVPNIWTKIKLKLQTILVTAVFSKAMDVVSDFSVSQNMCKY